MSQHKPTNGEYKEWACSDLGKDFVASLEDLRQEKLEQFVVCNDSLRHELAGSVKTIDSIITRIKEMKSYKTEED